MCKNDPARHEAQETDQDHRTGSGEQANCPALTSARHLKLDWGASRSQPGVQWDPGESLLVTAEPVKKHRFIRNLADSIKRSGGEYRQRLRAVRHVIGKLQGVVPRGSEFTNDMLGKVIPRREVIC